MELQYRTAETAGRGLDFVLSDGTLDRHGTRINPDGWDLRNFKLNPIALFGHRSDFPIGTWSNVRVVAGKLVGTLQLAEAGTSDRLDELIRLVEQGVLRAVSVGFSVLEFGVAGKSTYDFERQELHEASLVSVGSNPNALAKARALNVSTETLSLAFGEHAGERRGAGRNGEHAGTKTVARTPAQSANRPRPKVNLMSTLSQRIETAQNDLVAKRDRLVELNAADVLDLDAIEALNEEIETAERTVAALKTSEARIGVNATPAGGGAPPAPSVNRRPLGFPQREIGGFDLLVRAATANAIAFSSGRTIDKVLDQAYPGHEATALIARADQTIGTTTVSGWASELLQTVNQGFLQALTGFSIYPAIRDRGIAFSADGATSVKLPRRTGGTAGGGWVAEGSPIRVGKLTTAAAELTPKKMGVIVAYSDELGDRGVPQVEALVRRAILEDTAATLDSALLDATASSTARPAGLLNGVSAVASGYGGGDHEAVKADFKALLAPFISANAADGITVIMNPSQDLAIAMMDGPANNANWFSEIRGRVNFVVSTYATAGRLIAIRNSDFASVMGDVPRFDVSQQATIHMEDTTPLEIVSGTGPTTADPVRSLWQTASTGIRMILPVSWTMARTGMVQWIDTTSY